MADVLRNDQNSYFQKQNHIALKKTEVTKENILDAAVQRAAGLGKSIRSLARSLSNLFKSGEVGALFDPSTTGTLYTTTAMTIPATPGDPVGMMLDQSQWGGAALGSGTVAETLAPILGPELVTNGTFDTDLTGWTIGDATKGTAVQSAGRAVVTNVHANGSTGGFTSIIQPQATVVGRTYLITANTAGTSGVAVSNLASGAAAFASTTATGNIILRFVATAATTYLVLYVNSATDAATANFDNITNKEIPGYHATQATAAKRPIYGIHPFGGRRNLLINSHNAAGQALRSTPLQ